MTLAGDFCEARVMDANSTFTPADALDHISVAVVGGRIVFCSRPMAGAGGRALVWEVLVVRSESKIEALIHHLRLTSSGLDWDWLLFSCAPLHPRTCRLLCLYLHPLQTLACELTCIDFSALILCHQQSSKAGERYLHRCNRIDCRV